MNFTNVRGYNAYAQFSAKARETATQNDVSQKQETGQDISRSTYVEPVDTVTISVAARNASTSLNALQEDSTVLALRENTAQTELKRWIRESGTSNGVLAHRMSGQIMGDLLIKNGITIEEDEVYNITVDVWSAVSVVGRNAEKARAIQNLLNSTPGGISWGFLLQGLPPDR